MTRYYYTNPLHAALMAESFGVKYLEKGLIDAFSGCCIRLRALPDGYLNNGRVKFEIEKHDKKFYIHPDSMGIFEPKDDDWVSHTTMVDYERGINTIEPYVCAKNDPNSERDYKIISRNGLPFIMPEREEEDEKA